MVSAYVLIQTELGKPTQVATALAKVPGVLSALVVTGPYDVIASVEADDMDSLGKLISYGVQAVDGLTRTLTCPVVHV